MARKSGNYLDEVTLAPREGAKLYIYTRDADGKPTTTLATLTDDDDQPIDNPIVLDASGGYVANASTDVYYAEIWQGARKLREIEAFTFGEFSAAVQDTATQAALAERPTAETLADSGGYLLIGDKSRPEYWGIVDDDFASSQGTKIQNWLSGCVTDRITPTCPRPMRVRTTQVHTLDIAALVGNQRQQDIDLSNLYIQTNQSTGITIGSTTAFVDGATIRLPSVIRSTLSWTGTPGSDNAAIILNNLRSCSIFVAWHGCCKTLTLALM
jgi:hypothetical protein